MGTPCKTFTFTTADLSHLTSQGSKPLLTSEKASTPKYVRRGEEEKQYLPSFIIEALFWYIAYILRKYS